MEAKEVIEKLTKINEFHTWKTANPDHILAHIFVEEENVQVGYFNPKTQKITTFVLVEPLKIIPDQEILKGDSELVELNVDEIKLSLIEAKQKADDLLKEKYSKEIPFKSFVVIQNLDNKLLYNITYFSRSLQTINVKISAVDGTILHDSSFKLTMK